MKAIRGTDINESQEGVALLIAIFVLMLISIVALSMLLSSGMETSIAGNYRLATQSYYAAFAGLEEARGRLWSKHPKALGALIPNPLPVGTVRYIINPAAGEVVAPTNAANAFYDSEYFQEFGVQASTLGANAQTTPSIWGLAAPPAGLPGPFYKWVRITAKTEQSENLDIDGNGVIDAVNPIYYDGLHQYVKGNPVSLALFPNEPTGQKQVYRLTAMAVLPNGAKRMLQTDIAMMLFNFKFPGALTLDGKNPNYQKPTSVPFVVNGNDQSPGGANCPPPGASLPAVGVVGGNASINTVVSDIQQNPNRSPEYTGGGLPTPSVGDVTSSLPTTESSPSQLEAIVAQIESAADYVVQGPATSLPDYGTAANPVTVVVDSPNNGATGNLTISGNVTGYGILVVRGTYSPSGTVGWNGMVLVIGQGNIQGSGGGNNSYNGAVFIAQTRDASGNLLNNLGAPTFDWSGGGGNGIFYNSCSIANASNNQTYRVLSFSDIPE
jgi:hypothetical protein